MENEQRLHSLARLNVKLVSDKDIKRAREALSNMAGLKAVIQTFPDESDPELATMYVLEVNRSDVGSVLEQLRKNPYVEYAEQTAGRKLIR